MTVVTKNRGNYVQEMEFDEERFKNFFDAIVEDTVDKDKFKKDELQQLLDEVVRNITSQKEVSADRLFDYLIRTSNGKITAQTPYFTKFSASTMRRRLYKEASKNRGFDYHKGYGDYYSLVKMMVEQGIYHHSMIDKYTEEELREIGKLIVVERDKFFDYSGLQVLHKVFLKKDESGNDIKLYELPQERFLSAVTYLMQDEDEDKRLSLIKQAYDSVSKQYIGLATPTLKNAGSVNGTLSSCHIVTLDDDLQSIFNGGTQVARFSQEGAGLGVYLGNLRAAGSWIRGVKGNATGIIHPTRLQSVIAEYVNQGGVRKGGIAVYMPVWHGDIFDFLEIRLTTGSQEFRAHSVNTAVNMPDEFMRRLDRRELFTIFDPYEIKKKLGFDLNYMFDKKKLLDGETPNKEDHEFTYHYRLAEASNELELKRTVKATDIYQGIFTSRKGRGTPYMYWSDSTARMNPNGHVGTILCSNLCSEIAQNNSPDIKVSEELMDDGSVITHVESGDLVSCNLSSLVLHNVHDLSEDEYQDVVDIQFRMLDNVISLNRTAVPQATHTNNMYRAVGAGALGFVTLQTNLGVKWESDEAAELVKEVFKRYTKAQIKASHKLALEKGSYPHFEGSDWNTGEFFDKRGLVSEEWLEYREMASKGVRNGYMQAVAPTSTNSIITNGSPSIDPLYSVIYSENKSGVNVIIVPPNYSPETQWYYKSGFDMDEMWAINVVAAAQKYVDQGISHNYHVSENIKGSEMLRLDMAAWNKGLKTVYYTHTTDSDLPENCIMCEG